MATVQDVIVPQQLASVYQELGSNICRALALLTSKLTEMPVSKRAKSAREFAELREAKSLIGSLKFPDSTEHVRLDELAWALSRIKTAYKADAHDEWSGLFDKAAKMLGISLHDTHPMPLGLAHRIDNELNLLGYAQDQAPLAVAV